MKIPDWQKIKEIFNAAIELTGAGRAALLENIDADLRSEVEKLINSHERAGDFIAEPALVEIGLAEQNETDLYVGKQIDSYQILRQIGAGGMGTVYLAAHGDQSFEKRVALKLIKRGMDTSAVLKRFMLERQILARLEHPNIANLLDGGSTFDGLPYFVMEYVDGLPITKFCDLHQFSIEERLKLFQAVCAAVSYAHQNLVVHRDLKPSNILVTADGTPKLLDFGIAKLLSPDWSLETAEATATMFRLMTPEYASPEQLRGLPMTTTSDVYSLGVVLYELLSGERPYKIAGRLPEEVAQIVLTAEPLKPSLVISSKFKVNSSKTSGQSLETVDEQSPKSKVQSPKSQNLKSLRGDLDNIILKALRKEPERRYASVQELCEDIRRHLAGLPVTATADTSFYRAGKFIKRHRLGVSSGLLIVLTLITAASITTWQAIVARREQARAEQRFNQVRKLANTVLFDYHDSVAKLAGSTPIRERMVRDALEYLDNLANENIEDKNLKRELAAAYQKVGDVQGGASQSNLGNRAEAVTSYRKSLSILESLSNTAPNNEILVELAALYGKLNLSLSNLGQPEEGEKYSSQALTIREQLAAAEPGNLTYLLALARGYRDFGATLANRTKKDRESVIGYYQKSNELCDSVLAVDASNLEARAIAGLGYRRLGAEFEVNEPQRALEYYQKALSLTEEREKLDSQNAQIQLVLADCYSNIGRALMTEGNESGALEQFERAIKIYNARLETDPDDFSIKQYLSQTYNNIGDAMAQGNRLPAALLSYNRALEMRETAVREYPEESGYQTRLGETTFDLGDLYAKMADESKTPVRVRIKFWQEAKSWYQRSLGIWQELNRHGNLPGYQAAKPDETSKAISRCEIALAQLFAK